MPMTRFLVPILVIPLIAGCSREPVFNLDENAKQQFATLPGKIGVTIENGSEKWHRIISQGSLIKIDSLPEAPNEASAIKIGWVYGATGLPQQQGHDYRGPYLVSPDKRYVAASIAVAPSAPGPGELVIVETQTNKTIAKMGGSEKRYIDSIAWSPDSKWIAVLKHSSTKGTSPVDLIGQMFGHYDLYMTFYLEVFGLTGDLVVHSKLTVDLRSSWGWVVWLE
jgi:hypothetical protein